MKKVDVQGIIEAGHPKDFSRNLSEWVFWDMSFSKSKSSGLILPSGEEVTTTWSDACGKVLLLASERNRPLNIMLEAPLSFSFKMGNPIRRNFEPVNYEWYRNAGAGLAWGAGLFLLEISKVARSKVYLFEAFITNANKTRTNTRKDNHIRDARLMARHVSNDNTELLTNTTLPNSMIESSTKRFGLDFGIPPVLKADKDTSHE